MRAEDKRLGSIRKGEIVAVSPRDLNGEAEIDAVAPTHSFRAHLQSSSCTCSPTTPRICGAVSNLSQVTLSRTRKHFAMKFHVARADCRASLGGLSKQVRPVTRPDIYHHVASFLHQTDPPRWWYNAMIGAGLSKRSRKGNVGT